jgi:hypothetical protein
MGIVRRCEDNPNSLRSPQIRAIQDPVHDGRTDTLVRDGCGPGVEFNISQLEAPNGA